MSKEARRLALEKIASVLPAYIDGVAAREYLTVIHKALAVQPAQQEPLEYWNAVEGWVKIDEVREHFDSVGCGTIYKTPGDGRVPLTTAQRKPLSNEEIYKIYRDCGDLNVKINIARAIEAAHNIKENK